MLPWTHVACKTAAGHPDDSKHRRAGRSSVSRQQTDDAPPPTSTRKRPPPSPSIADMSRLFPHTVYAEDQPLAHTILATHVLTRAVTMGTLVGLGVAGTRQLVPSLRRAAGPLPLPARALLAASSGSLAAAGVTAVGLAFRMRGRAPVEWQDRSWRLLENEGQLETDDWTYAGMGAAAAAAVGAGPVRALGWRGLVGAMGLGSVGGMVGYLAWRYGVNGGRFPDKNRSEREGGI